MHAESEYANFKMIMNVQQKNEWNSCETRAGAVGSWSGRCKSSEKMVAFSSFWFFNNKTMKILSG